MQTVEVKRLNRKDLFSNVGRRVADLRKAAGMSQAEVAELADLSNESISRLERGVTMPSLEKLVKIVEAMNVEPKELLEWEKDREVSEKDQLIRSLSDLLHTRTKSDVQMAYEIVARIFKK